MPRPFSEKTVMVLMFLWDFPWASAGDLLKLMERNCEGVTQEGINNALATGIRAGWLLRAKLGRTDKAVWRYVFSSDGIQGMSNRYGMPVSWWHSALGIKALAGKLDVVETAYSLFPRLWQSNLVEGRRCYVYRRMLGGVWRNGVLDADWQIELRESDWSGGRLRKLVWLERGLFEAIAIFDDGHDEDTLLHFPILQGSDFARPRNISSLRRDMEGLLVQDTRWLSLPNRQALAPYDYLPGAVLLSPDRGSAAQSQRNWRESLHRENASTLAIVDILDGQLVRQMAPPTAWWSGFELPAFEGRLGDISKVVNGLQDGPYATINGPQAWQVFRSLDRAPGKGLENISESAKLEDSKVVEKLLGPMLTKKVVRKWRDGYYVAKAGRKLLRDSQGLTDTQVSRRLKSLGKKNSAYRSRHRIHNEGQANSIMYLIQHGFPAFPVLGLAITYTYDGNTIRVDPDGLVITEPGVLSALEFERSSVTPAQLRRKVGEKTGEEPWLVTARKYVGLARIGRPIPGLIITETEEAARRVAELCCPYILAATLEAVRKGPHGRAEIIDGVDRGTPGCWWYWYPDEAAPRSNAPIDLAAKLYLQDYPDGVWRLPVDRPLTFDGA